MARRGKRGNARNLVRMPMAKCKKCRRMIFGGPKGMATHKRNSCGKGKKVRRNKKRRLAALAQLKARRYGAVRR
jgi:hypothetical protein